MGFLIMSPKNTLWSDPPSRTQSIDDRGDDLRSALEAAGLSPPYLLVAHSYGGLLARRFAKRWPQDVTGVVLVDAPPESVLFKPSFLAYCAKGASFQRILAAAARIGLLRLCARWLPMLLLPDEPAARAACVSPAFMTATAEDFSSLVRAPLQLRTPEQPAELGDTPLVVLAQQPHDPYRPTRGRPGCGPPGARRGPAAARA